MQFRTPVYFLFSLILITSCGNNPGENKSAPINCYRYANAGDTIILKLIHVGESITGTLVYKMPQKNTSKGTILGEMNKDLLVVRYTPIADSTVVQQKVFKLNGVSYVEGYGETFTDNGQVRFKDIHNLQFADTSRLVEIPCQ